ncbi:MULTISPECIES: hypothetical protein [Bacillus]|nr:hypothetical protein [Bacillus licheniformis]EQM25336.1 hypothetical protein N399_24090 [Bacillus licheniformis CG-B52]MEC3833640.1 hypothetical protein [Bacillus licheniformis]OLQ50026.1 hypothetical protein BHT96_07715 [Bacillus licheniformis]TWN27177.1 hypothetical protein CHCC14557_3778 [Bacillus licheniformis]
MLAIKNPHSKKRLSNREKFNKRFTDFLVPYIKKIPLEDDWSVKTKYIPKVLKLARKGIDVWERDKWTNEMPRDVELDFLSLYVAEYIPTEHVDKLNRGLKKLIQKFPPKHQFEQLQHLEWLDEFCNGVKQSIHGGRWSNFGIIDIGKEPKLSKFVKQIHVYASHVTSSSVILQFVITPSDNFVREYKSIAVSDIKEGSVFEPSFKNFSKFWKTGGLAYSIIKNQMLEDLIIELKWRTMSEINKYFDLYFTNNKLIPPSIEVYKLKQLSCTFKPEDNGKFNEFWRSVGMDNLYDISKDGFWQLFSEGRDPYFIDCSLKVTCNTEIDRESMFHSLEFQIVYLLQEFAQSLLPILAMREYALDVSKKMAIQQNETFLSIKKVKPKYKRLINVRFELEQNIQILKRFKNEISDNYFENVKAEIQKMTKFEPSRPQYGNILISERIIENASYLIDKTYSHSHYFAKMIDDTAKLLEIRTNNSLRTFTFSLTITTVILSIIATAISGVSFYTQLDNGTKDYLQNLFNEITNFFW